MKKFLSVQNEGYGSLGFRLLELVLDGEDGAIADAEFLCVAIVVEVILVTRRGNRGNKRQVLRDEPGEVGVVVVVVANVIADVDALFVFEADGEEVGWQDVDVAKSSDTIFVVADDAIDDFIRDEHARRKKDGKGRFGDELRGDEVEVRTLMA